MMIQLAAMFVLRVLTIIGLAGFVSAATGSSQIVGYESAGNHRGTVELVWSCLATLLACVWSVIHLNVPGPSDTVTGIALRRLKWMIIMILAPEIVCGWGYTEWCGARQSLKPMSDEGYENWSMVHGFFAGQGGFVLEWGRESKKRLPILWRQLLIVMKYGITIPKITRADINDRSKADHFAKGFACIQSAWLVMNVVARAGQGLAVSQLELMTIAYIFCAIISYGFLWYKPYGVRVPIVIHHFEDAIPGDLWNKLAEFEDQLDIGNEWPKERVENLSLPDTRSTMIIPQGSAIGFFGILFTGLHIGGWNFEYPSPAELLLWRSCGVVALLYCPFLILMAQFSHQIQGVFRKTLATVVFVIFTVIYCLARMYLVVEAFISLRAVPASLYETPSWLSGIPHV